MRSDDWYLSSLFQKTRKRAELRARSEQHVMLWAGNGQQDYEKLIVYNKSNSKSLSNIRNVCLETVCTVCNSDLVKTKNCKRIWNRLD